MEKLILTLHIIVCVVLVILVLLQSGKEGMGVIFGGGSSSLFGSTGAGGILVKLTTFIAVIFLATSLGYNIVTSAKTSRHSTVIDIPLDDPSAPSKPSAPANATSQQTPAQNSADNAPANTVAPGASSFPSTESSASSAPASSPTPEAPSTNQPQSGDSDSATPTTQAVPAPESVQHATDAEKN